MPEAEFYRWWYIGYALGALVVAIVAALLGVILVTARRIERLAAVALGVTGEIEQSTRPIWALADANAITEDIVRTVRSIEARTAEIADALAPRGAR